VLPNSWKSALIPFFAGIPRRTGYIGELRWGLLNDARKLDKTRLRMTVQRFVALAASDNGIPEYAFPRLSISTAQQQAVCEKFGIGSDRKILALCPGAEYGPAKRWPVEHFAAVAQAMQAQGWQVWLLGSDKDKPVTSQINALSGQVCWDFAGTTDLAEAVDLMSLAAVVISNDSGLMHVAAALDKKLIALYGSSDPGFTPPLHKDAVIINLKLDCSPCFKRDCPLGHTHCLTGIAPERVLAAIPH
jgi:heptosyltransferase-2